MVPATFFPVTSPVSQTIFVSQTFLVHALRRLQVHVYSWIIFSDYFSTDNG